ncbi:MAG TPA: hypothetical protein VLK58_13725 [Conexibacter sp.]|nr:hypothetical protein [Conexibacter sp.]
MLRCFLRALALALLVLPSLAVAADAADPTKYYEVNVSGEYSQRWNLQTEGYPNRCLGWTFGDGDATAKTNAGLTDFTIYRDGRRGLVGYSGSFKRSTAVLETRFAIRYHSSWAETSECMRCDLGELRCQEPVADAQYTDGCRRAVRSHAHVAANGGKIKVTAGFDASTVLADCSRVTPKERVRFDVRAIEFDFPGVTRLWELPVGEPLTLTDRVQVGPDCGRMFNVVGYRSCAARAVKVTFTRVLNRGDVDDVPQSRAPPAGRRAPSSRRSSPRRRPSSRRRTSGRRPARGRSGAGRSRRAR